MKLRLLASSGILGQVEFFSGKAREGAEEARVWSDQAAASQLLRGTARARHEIPTAVRSSRSTGPATYCYFYYYYYYYYTRLTACFPGQPGLAGTRNVKSVWILMRQEITGFWDAVASAGPYMRTICTSLQTDNHTSTSSLNFFSGQMLFLMPYQ